MRNIIRFGIHDSTHGHIIERKRCGFPSKWRNMRLKVEKINGVWIDEKGQDVNDAIVIIQLASYEKKLTKLYTSTLLT